MTTGLHGPTGPAPSPKTRSVDQTRTQESIDPRGENLKLNTRWLITISVLLLGSYSQYAASPLDEHDVVQKAIRSATGFSVLNIENEIDSLNLQKTLSRRLPQVTARVTPSVPFTDSDPQATVTTEIGVGQTLPGGGTLEGSITSIHGGGTDSTAIGVDNATTAQISLTQPLLRNAWNYAPLEYDIRIARFDRQQFKLNQIQQIMSDVSAVRSQYWSLYESQFLEHKVKALAEYAAKRLEVAKARFELGTVPPIDTLSAHLEFLKTRRNLLNAQSDVRLTRLALADTLNIDVEELDIDTGTAIRFDSIPEAPVLLQEIESFDPRIRLFEVLSNRLEDERRMARRAFLPAADLGFTYSRSIGGSSLWGNDLLDRDHGIVSLVLSYQLPTRTRRLEHRQTELRIEKTRREATEYETGLIRLVEEFRLQWEREIEALAISEAEVRVAQQKLDAALRGYEVGTVDAVALSEAETDFLQASVQNIQSTVTLKRLEIGLDEATGRTLEKFGITWDKEL